MIRAWLRRWLGVGDPPAPSRSALEERVNLLEERVDYQELAVRKLRGRVTGSLRNDNPDGVNASATGADDGAAPSNRRGNPLALELLAKRNRAVSR